MNKLLHTPLTVHNVELANRLVMPPMATGKTPDGTVQDDLLAYYDARSRGGCIGLIVTEHAYISPEGKAHEGQLSVSRDTDIPMVALHWEKYLEHIIQKYNKIYRIQMPKVTPHVCRHTFCSNMAKSGMNPKTLQYIMGHSDISVTLNVYTHVQFDDAQAELLRVAKA